MIDTKKIKNNNNLFLTIFFNVSMTVFAFGFSFFVFTCILPPTKIVKADEVKWVPPTGHSIIGLNIANNGMVFLRNARVVSISGSTIVVSISWNILTMEWTIHTNESYYGNRHFGTNFLDHSGNRINIEDINVGDSLNINGMIENESTDLAIQANVIRTSY